MADPVLEARTRIAPTLAKSRSNWPGLGRTDAKGLAKSSVPNAQDPVGIVHHVEDSRSERLRGVLQEQRAFLRLKAGQSE